MQKNDWAEDGNAGEKGNGWEEETACGGWEWLQTRKMLGLVLERMVGNEGNAWKRRTTTGT